MIPLRTWFAGPGCTCPRLSGDRGKVAYLERHEQGRDLVLRDLAGGNSCVLVPDIGHSVGWLQWAADDRHLLFLCDRDGDQNWHLWCVNTESRELRDLTPFDSVRVQNVLVNPQFPEEILAGLNLHHPAYADMYRIRLADGLVTLDTKNPGDVMSWVADRWFVVRAATAFDPASGATSIRVRSNASEPWRDLLTTSFEDSVLYGQINGGSLVCGFTHDGSGLYAISSAESDTSRLVELDCKTGEVRRVIASHAAADVAERFTPPDYGSEVDIDPRTGEVRAVMFESGEPSWVRLDGGERFKIDEVRHASQPTRYCFDGRELFSEHSSLTIDSLAPRRAFEFETSDGLRLNGFVTEPRTLPAPMVVLVHGGPWMRDRWGFDVWPQFLAERGYAVLQVNHRGSIGFGKRYLNRGNLEFGRRMVDDLAEAAGWAVGQGIAHGGRIAIMGASAGGYAALQGVMRTPNVYRAAIDMFGPTDLRLLLSTMPPGYGAAKVRWTRRMGDVEADDALNRELSPLYNVDRIRTPLLIAQGENDPIVTAANSERMVECLRARGVDVEYARYAGEGHGFTKPANLVDFAERVERFLARHLGGVQ